jgi:hypothetical protein
VNSFAANPQRVGRDGAATPVEDIIHLCPYAKPRQDRQR